jgi:hypothetical protein
MGSGSLSGDGFRPVPSADGCRLGPAIKARNADVRLCYGGSAACRSLPRNPSRVPRYGPASPQKFRTGLQTPSYLRFIRDSAPGRPMTDYLVSANIKGVKHA